MPLLLLIIAKEGPPLQQAPRLAHEQCSSGVRHALTSRDTETVGCDPSLSSISVRDQRSFADALAEVAAWLAAPGRGREMLLVYLDDQPDLLDWVRASHRQASSAAVHHTWDLACMLLGPA